MAKFNELLKADEQYLAFCKSHAVESPVVFGIKSSEAHEVLEIMASHAGSSAKVSTGGDTTFTLSGQPFKWQAFFSSVPTPPFHSYWGMWLVNS